MSNQPSALPRSAWPVRVVRLGEKPESLAEQTTPEERLAMMWPLARDTWAMMGGDLPACPRNEMPVRVVRRRS